MFKSRLQEYAQKMKLSTPVYETTKEGPSHEPFFRSTVILNDVRYDSLPGFTNRKASEQSAAEVALTQLAKSGSLEESISQPVYETGLCKNQLQEYAQKMNYAIPSYECRKIDKGSRGASFSCTADVGGIRYIGAAAKTKKEAEIKAARTALLAILSSGGKSSEKPDGNSQLTVIPSKRKVMESSSTCGGVAQAPKQRKSQFKKRRFNRKLPKKKFGKAQRGVLEGHTDAETRSKLEHEDASGVQAAFPENFAVETTGILQDVETNTRQNETELCGNKYNLVPANGDMGGQMISEVEQGDASGVQTVNSGLLAVEIVGNLHDVKTNVSQIQIQIPGSNDTILHKDAQTVMDLEHGDASGIETVNSGKWVVETVRNLQDVGTNTSQNKTEIPDNKDDLVPPNGSMDAQRKSEVGKGDACGVQTVESGKLAVDIDRNLQDVKENSCQNETEISGCIDDPVLFNSANRQNVQLVAPNVSESAHGSPNSVICTMPQNESSAPLVKEANRTLEV